MFLRETVIRKAGKEYRYWRLVKTYWDKKERKVRHKTVAQLGKLSDEEVIFFKNTLGGRPGRRFSWVEITAQKSFEYLGVVVLDRLWRYWQLDRIFPGSAAEVLVLNRCLSPVSDYRVSRWYEGTVLPRLLRLVLNPTKIYRTLNELYSREAVLQRHLYKRIQELSLDDYTLIFYDITSTYFQESGCELASYGHSRDHRRDKKQILLGLAVTKKGFPFYWDVFAGNIADKKTVEGFIEVLRRDFGIRRACLVVDRGMVSEANLEKIDIEGLDYVVTLTKPAIRKAPGIPWGYLKTITERNVDRKLKYFSRHSKRSYYKELPRSGGRRYILCFNPEKFSQERNDRLEKIASIREYLDRKNKILAQAKGRRHREILRYELKKYLERRSAQRIVTFRLTTRGKSFHINYKVSGKALREAALLDGVYVIMTNVPDVQARTVIAAYQSRMEIERSFHQLKSFVEIRPVYHHTEERIRAHVSVCVLAYLLNNTVMRLARRKDDFDDLTAQSIYGSLTGCKLVELRAAGEKRLKITPPTKEQTRLTEILSGKDLLNEDRLQKTLS